MNDEPEQHRGGAWKVAYADFVTALMALFIVLWLMSSSREVQEAVGGYFRDPHGFEKMYGSGTEGLGQALQVSKGDVDKIRDRLERAVKELPAYQNIARYIKFTTTADGLRIELMENEGGLFFETGSPRPTPRGEELFRLLGHEVRNLSNPLVIEGHTDSRPFRSTSLDSYGNWELSFDRANMARRIMLANGLEAERIVEIRGFADRNQLPGLSPDDSRNRRISIVMKYRHE